MTKKKKDKEQIVNEPEAAYNRKQIRIYHSFEEAEAADIEKSRKQSPLDRIRETVELILRVYGFTEETLKARPRNNHIKITRYE